MHHDQFVHYHGKQRCNGELCCPLSTKEVEQWIVYQRNQLSNQEIIQIEQKMTLPHNRDTLICEYLLKNNNNYKDDIVIKKRCIDQGDDQGYIIKLKIK